MGCPLWSVGRGHGWGDRRKGGSQELRFLLFLCMVSLTEHMVPFNLLGNFNKRGWREGRETGDQRGERGRQTEGRREERRNEEERGRKLTKQKISAGQTWFTIRSHPTFPECEAGEFYSFLFSFFPPKGNVLTYLEEEVFALCEALTEETVAEALSMHRLGAVWSLAGVRQVQKGAEVGGDGERA